jgi:hypothetical protein
VRSAFSPSRSRCTQSMDCCSTLLTGTKRIAGREAASQMAVAPSAAAFSVPREALLRGRLPHAAAVPSSLGCA